MKSLLFLFIIFSISLSAQSVLEQKINVPVQEKKLTVILSELERDYPVHFYYLPEWLEPFSITANDDGKSLNKILTTLFAGTDFSFIVWDAHSIVMVKDPSRALQNKAIISTAKKEQKKIEKVSVGNPGENKGRIVTLRGQVIDAKTKLPIAGAQIGIIDENSRHVITNGTGAFEIKIREGEHVISLAYVGYEEKVIELNVYKSDVLNLEMEELPRMLDEVVISDVASSEITTSRIGQTQISIRDVKRAPTFLGMTDIIKQVQTQAGVTSVSEASSGFNVRGGGVDQNLILFDGVPVFNTSHALGFFTAFNAEAVGQATFYKGGIPSEFGGRVSSVLNLTTREGDLHQWKGVGGVGFVAADLTVGGPIKKDTSSLIISFRSSYSDWILNLLKTRYKDINQGSVFFYDGSFKYAQRLSNKGKLIFSGYTSEDRFKLSNDTINQWRNITTSVRYDYVTNKNFYYSIGLAFGHYAYQVEEEDPLNAFRLNYKITYPSLKLDFTHENGIHKQLFGFHSTFYSFSPGKLRPTSTESDVTAQTMVNENSIESAIYFSDTFRWKERFNIDVGMRLSMYNRLGSGVVYNYSPGSALEVRNTIDSTYYGAGKIMKTYLGPEPRVSVQYTLGKQSSLKLGYNHMYQYVHLISNTAAVTPVDIWQSSNFYFKPQQADQISLGYFANSKENSYEFSVETFYKTVKNILDFKDGASLILNTQLETALLRGKGKSYGVELLINKLSGKLTGGINYTYSRSLRKVNGNSDLEKINKGAWYASNYDQPNIINVNWRYAIARKIFFTGFFTYHTGRPVSLPIGAYTINHVPVTDFSERNNYRISDYHRLDVAIVFEGNNKKNKNWEGSWVVSFYNVYGRKNPYSVFFADQGGGVLLPYQLSLVGTVVPSLTYRFKF